MVSDCYKGPRTVCVVATLTTPRLSIPLIRIRPKLWAELLRTTGAEGLVYPRVRNPTGERPALLHPALGPMSSGEGISITTGTEPGWIFSRTGTCNPILRGVYHFK